MTKGEWNVDKIIWNDPQRADEIYVVIGDGESVIARIAGEESEDLENAELIALAGNLNQKYELNALPLLIKVVQMAVGSYKDFGFILKSDFDELKQALSKIERQQ